MPSMMLKVRLENALEAGDVDDLVHDVLDVLVDVT